MPAPRRRVVMLGPSPQAKGGVAAVVNVYRDAGLFVRWPIEYVTTAVDGSAAQKLVVAAKALCRFIVLLGARRIALVHAHTGASVSFRRKLPFLLLAFIVRRPVVLHLHDGNFPDYYWKRCGAFQRALVRMVFRRAARVVFLSDQWRARIESIEPAARLIKIVNPVLAAADAPVEDDAREPTTLLFLGWLTAQKGVYDLLAACERLRIRFPALKILFGGNRGVEDLERKARELGIANHVRALGWVEGETKSKLLRAATVFCLPSYVEGLPMGVLEAMAAGTPVIATRVGGVPDAISNGVEGFLIEPGDVDALVNATTALLADPALRQRMGAAGRAKIAGEFAAERVIARIDAIYRDLGGTPIDRK